MAQLFTNNANSTLLSPISASALSLQVAAGEGALFPSPTGGDYFLATLNKVIYGIESDFEIVKVTARSTDVFTIVRAQEGTTAQIYAASDKVSLRLTAAVPASLATHLGVTAGNPHGTTATDLGLGNVNNTSDINKPVSTAQASAIALKQDVLAAASTSTNGYLTSTDWNTFNNKQSTLVSGTNIKTVNGTSVLGSGDLVIASGGGAGSNLYLFSNFGGF